MTHIETETNLNWDTYHHPNPAMSWDVMGSVAQGETRWESLFAAPWLHMLWNLDHYSSGWWYTYPSEKYESVGMMTFPMEKLNSCSKPPTSHRLIAPNRSRQKKNWNPHENYLEMNLMVWSFSHHGLRLAGCCEHGLGWMRLRLVFQMWPPKCGWPRLPTSILHLYLPKSIEFIEFTQFVQATELS